MRALIIGAGIGGLASAIGLCRAGWDVTIRERGDWLPDAGTGLGIWPEGLHALDRLGLGEQLRARALRQPAAVLRRPSGKRIGRIDTARIERRTGEPVYLISRPALLDLLYRAAPRDRVHFGAPVADPGSHLPGYDVVVGADGINSRTRTELFGDRYGLRYSGVMAWRGVVDADVEQGGEVWAPGRKFGFTPQEPGRTNWYAALRLPEGYLPPGGDVRWLRGHFDEWHQPIPDLLARIRPEGLLRHALHYLDPALPSYVRGNAVLVGDAAHAMTPDLGQGACQALIDGLVLADCLTGAADIHSGLREYDRRRRRPTQRLARMSLLAGRLALSARFLRARDALTRAMLAVA